MVGAATVLLKRNVPYRGIEMVPGAAKWKARTMTDSDLSHLRERAADGDRDAVGQLIELAAEREDFDELHRLADSGSKDAADQLVELASDKGALDELRRLAAGGNSDAADVLAELTEEDGKGAV